MDFLLKPHRRPLFLLLVTLAGYIGAFVLLHHTIGASIAMFALLPVLVCAWYWGLWAGISAGVLSALLNVLLFHLEGASCSQPFFSKSFIPGHIAQIIMGGIVGHMSDLRVRLEKANVEISDLTAMIVHDLKKPLTALKTACGLMQGGKFDPSGEDARRVMKTGVDAVKQMQDLLDELLECTKYESGKQPLHKENVDLSALLKDTVGRLRLQIDEKKIAVAVETYVKTLETDPYVLSKVLMNLIGNAIQYIGEGAAPAIRISARREDGRVLFRIEDNGLGIAPEDLAHIFSKFKRGRNTAGITGTGLGLAIVRAAVEALGGSIAVESGTGKGTAFTFTIPG
jgi:signal transduction histidine kinase